LVLKDDESETNMATMQRTQMDVRTRRGVLFVLTAEEVGSLRALVS
jgi:hypothetical protein